MCGINGIFNYREPRPVDRQLAARMTAAIRHRGPDDRGEYFFDPAGLFLGHRRLSIIDLAAGHQPMCNEDESVWIVFNGEIYNFPDLRKELSTHGHRFKTRSDTETILHAYEQWGSEAFSRLNGMFGFALWDEKDRTLFLARDPFGIKPLYYWDNGKSVVFASEVKAILHHPLVKREVDLAALSDFFTITYVPSPATAFRDIRKLAPGHVLVYSPRGSKKQRFYRKEPALLQGVPEKEILEELQQKISAAIHRQMISDVPIGAMLSGGVDSSTLATIMTEISGSPIRTFTVGFENDFKYNELDQARAVAKQIGSDHHEAVVSSREYMSLLPRSIWHMEEPVATGSILAYYQICKLARQHVKVVLTGQGADEPFAGYYRHLGERYGFLYRAVPAFLSRSLIVPLVNRLPRRERLKRGVVSLGVKEPVNRMVEVYQTIGPNLKRRLFGEELLKQDDSILREAVQLWQADVAKLDHLSQMLYVDSRLSLPDNLLLYGDKMSMAVSLEARVPFLDLELMEFVERIPPGLKIKGTTQKYLLKKAASKWISPEIVKRKKIGFATPVDQWFQREMRKTVEERLLAPGSACTRFLQPETIRQMLQDHQSGRHDYKRVLFSLLTFEIWHEQFIQPAKWKETAFPMP